MNENLVFILLLVTPIALFALVFRFFMWRMGESMPERSKISFWDRIDWTGSSDGSGSDDGDGD